MFNIYIIELPGIKEELENKNKILENLESSRKKISEEKYQEMYEALNNEIDGLNQKSRELHGQIIIEQDELNNQLEKVSQWIEMVESRVAELKALKENKLVDSVEYKNDIKRLSGKKNEYLNQKKAAEKELRILEICLQEETALTLKDLQSKSFKRGKRRTVKGKVAILLSCILLITSGGLGYLFFDDLKDIVMMSEDRKTEVVTAAYQSCEAGDYEKAVKNLERVFRHYPDDQSVTGDYISAVLLSNDVKRLGKLNSVIDDGDEWDEILAALVEVDVFAEKEVVFESVTASSSFTEGSQTYSPENLIDNELDSVWCEGKPDSGIGEWVLFDFPTGFDIETIQISNGYQGWTERSGNLYPLNNRAKELNVYADDVFIRKLNLEDSETKTTFYLGIYDVCSIKIELAAVYVGSRWNDTCISEISFNKE